MFEKSCARKLPGICKHAGPMVQASPQIQEYRKIYTSDPMMLQMSNM